MSKSALIILGIVLWLLLSLLCFSCHRTPIQDKLTAEATAALENGGIQLENVSFDGRTAVLSGSIPTNSLAARAEELVAAHPGVFRVRNNLIVGDGPPAADTPPPGDSDAGVAPSFDLQFDDNGIVLNGRVPDEATRQAMYDAAVAKVGAANVENNLTVDASLATPDWLARIPDMLPAMADSVSSGNIAIYAPEAPNDVVLSGTVGTQGTKDFIGREAARILGNDVDISNQIRVSAAQMALDQLLAGKVIEFALDGTELTPRSQRLLDEVAQALRQYPDANVAIEGHTDSRGRDAYNLELSQRRANAVRAYLVQQGIANNRLTATGYGETRPIRSNNTEAGRQANRRVEFKVL